MSETLTQCLFVLSFHLISVLKMKCRVTRIVILSQAIEGKLLIRVWLAVLSKINENMRKMASSFLSARLDGFKIAAGSLPQIPWDCGATQQNPKRCWNVFLLFYMLQEEVWWNLWLCWWFLPAPVTWPGVKLIFLTNMLNNQYLNFIYLFIYWTTVFYVHS